MFCFEIKGTWFAIGHAEICELLFAISYGKVALHLLSRMELRAASYSEPKVSIIIPSPRLDNGFKWSLGSDPTHEF